MEINDNNNVARKISHEELNILASMQNNSLVSICQYYVRDTRLFELYMLLRYLCFLKLKKHKNANRKSVEEIMKKTNSINNNNWRNVWISLSSLGLINADNLPTKSGLNFGMLEFDDFLIMMYKSYIKPYVEVLIKYFENSNAKLKNNLQTIKQDILEQFNGKDVLFLTQSQTRYLSSWLNILRDDFGCLDFQARSHDRILNYNPLEMNDKSLKENISKFTKSTQYINKLSEIIQ